MESNRACTILFQGDSITDGNRGRSDDPNHLWGHGYVFLIASEIGLKAANKGAAGQAPVIINRGISGNRVSDLYGRWEEDALTHQPDLISIMAGVNDVHEWVNSRQDRLRDRFVRTYRRLIEDTLEMLPSAKIVLCEPFLLPVGYVKDEWEAWHSEMRRKQEQVAQLAEECKLDFTPLQRCFDEACEQAPPEYWLWDGIHPTPAGHAIVAKQWLEFYSRHSAGSRS